MLITSQDTVLFKAVAISFILLAHLFPPFLPYHDLYIPIKRVIGQMGVNIFFLLSGYGIFLTYLKRDISARGFLKRRLVRIWPIYMFTVLVCALLQTLIFRESVSLKSLALHLLGLQVYFGVQSDICNVLHFMNALLVVYLFTAASLMFGKSSARVFVVGTLLAVHVWAFYLYNGRILWIDYFSSFAVGILAAKVGQGEGLSREDLPLIGLFSILFFSQHSLLIFALTLLVLWPLRIFIKSGTGGDRPWVGLLTWLGLNSYVVFLGHNYFFWKWPALMGLLGSKMVVGVVILAGTGIWLAILLYVDRAVFRRLPHRPRQLEAGEITV